MDYKTSLLENNKIELLEPLGRVKDKHRMKCTACNHVWSATPISKTQTYRKSKSSGCPGCKKLRADGRAKLTRAANIQTLLDRGLVVLCDWDGRNSKNNKPFPVTVRNINCGHTFTSTTSNLLYRNIDCTVCGIAERNANITEWSLNNSAEWRKTAPEWLAYRSVVDSLTYATYNQHESTINPDKLPRGKAGVEGAYHLDHIVPVRYGFDNNIPAEIIAHQDNLQMLDWHTNVSEGAKLKDIEIPVILKPYFDVQLPI